VPNLDNPQVPEEPKKKKKLKKSLQAPVPGSFMATTRGKVAATIAGITVFAGGYLVSRSENNAQPAPQITDSPQPKSTQKDSGTPELHEKNPEKREIKLGNVRLYFLEGNKISQDEQKKILETLQNAYKKLVDYFGEEIIQSTEAMDCPIIVQPSEKKQTGVVRNNASISWNSQVTYSKEKDIVTISKAPRVGLTITNASEDVLFHEMIHLFVHPQILRSLGFREGHAHALQKLMYGDQAHEGKTGKLFEDKRLRGKFENGMDIPFYSSEVFQGGLNDKNTTLFADKLFEHQWLEYLKIDPDFFKKFYKEIAIKKRQGIYDISKKEALEIAATVSVPFREWYKKSGGVLHDIDPKEKDTVRAFTSSDGKYMIIQNMKSVAARSAIYQASVVPSLEGPLEVTLEVSGQGKKTVRLLEKATPIMQIADLDGKKILKIQVGAKEIPFEK
jgi:hypothetical protein